MKASDAIVAFLERKGIECVFGYQGGMITHLVDSISRSRKVSFIQCYHEQSAAFAAEGYARESGKFGVCITTSGPGATNAITSIANAYFDSIPVLYITGQVNSYEYKYSSRVRQRGFQETDIVSVARPIAKAAEMVDDPANLMDSLEKAVDTMTSGRKGPVLLDIPMDVQRAEIDGKARNEAIVRQEAPARCDDSASRAIAAFKEAKRPLVLCGGGLAERTANAAARRFLAETGLPYVVTLMGKGLVDESHGGFAGMIGSYGNRAANMILSESDAVLCLGSRLDSRQLGNRSSDILSRICFIRIDVDGDELRDRPLAKQIAVHMRLQDFLGLREFADAGIRASGEWLGRISAIRSAQSQRDDVRMHAENTIPYDALSAISQAAGDDALFVADVGQNQMWAAQTIKCSGGRGFRTSGGMAPMGYAVPAAAGSAFANPNRQIVCICGDGGLHISTQSLMLVSQYRLPVAIVVVNNHALGMITQFQKLYFGGNLHGTTASGGYITPDWSMMARSYGLEYRLVSPDEVTPQLLKGPILIEIDTQGLTTVVPKLEYDKGLRNMSPPWPVDP